MFCYFDTIPTSDKQIDATVTYTNVENLLDPEGGGYLGKCGPYRTYCSGGPRYMFQFSEKQKKEEFLTRRQYFM